MGVSKLALSFTYATIQRAPALFLWAVQIVRCIKHTTRLQLVQRLAIFIYLHSYRKCTARACTGIGLYIIGLPENDILNNTSKTL